MKKDIVIVFPKKYFTKQNLKRLNNNSIFIDTDKEKIDLDKLNILFKSDNLILSADPSYLTKSWDSFTNQLIEKMVGLKGLCLTTNSYNYADCKFCKEKDVIVTNCPNTSTNAVAEYNIFMMNALLKRLPLVSKNGSSFSYKDFITNEYYSLKVGVIGLGKIGEKVAELCTGLKMDVVYFNRSNKKVPYEKVSLKRLFKESDAIFNTIAYCDETKNLVSEALVDSMKKSAMLISTSRPVFNHQLIIKKVERNELGGYAFESNEKIISDFKGNIFVTPEIAYYTEETMFNIADTLTSCISSLIEEKPINVVN